MPMCNSSKKCKSKWARSELHNARFWGLQGNNEDMNSIPLYCRYKYTN